MKIKSELWGQWMWINIGVFVILNILLIFIGLRNDNSTLELIDIQKQQVSPQQNLTYEKCGIEQKQILFYEKSYYVVYVWLVDGVTITDVHYRGGALQNIPRPEVSSFTEYIKTLETNENISNMVVEDGFEHMLISYTIKQPIFGESICIQKLLCEKKIIYDEEWVPVNNFDVLNGSSWTSFTKVPLSKEVEICEEK